MNPKIVLAGLLAMLAAGPATGKSTELVMRAVLDRKASQLYEHEEFEALDAMLDMARERELRTESGVWQLLVMHKGITEGMAPPQNEAQAKAHADHAQLWLKRRPGSVEAPLVVAEVEMRHARALGCGQCEVDAGANRDELYLQSLRRAYDLLQAARAKSSVDPQWYADMVQLGGMSAWPRQQMDGFIGYATKQAPGYYTIWFNAVDVMLRDRETAAARIEELARQAMYKTKDTEGASMYARIWWYAAQVGYGDALFSATPIVWKDFDSGVRDTMQRYPDDWNANNFANFACLAGHPARSRELMAGHALVEEAWSSEQAYDHCVGRTQLST